MRFLYNHGTEDARRTAFYRAVEECPWVKVSVVVDANIGIVFFLAFVFIKMEGSKAVVIGTLLSIKYMLCSDDKVLRA